jgi:uncharacterized protein
MEAAAILREARRESGLSQTALAARTGTSQATISAYETGAKEPSLSTLARLLAATGHSIEVAQNPPTEQPSSVELRRRGKILAEVLSLAEALPSRRHRRLQYPPLRTLVPGHAR